MNEPIKIPPPVLDSDNAISIHMGYVRRDIDEIKTVLKEMKNGYVSYGDFQEHLKTDEDHEKRIRSIEENTADIKTIKRLVYGCAGLILTSVIMAMIYFIIHK